MKTTIDLSLIRECVSATINDPATDFSLVFLRIASLFAEYTLADIERNMQILEERGFLSPKEKNILESESVLCDHFQETGSRRFQLKDGARHHVYKSFVNFESLREFARKLDFEQSGPLQQMMLNIIRGDKPEPTNLNMEELVALHRVVGWFGVLLDTLPDKKTIEREIKLKERLAPFLQSTRYFAGRQTELQTLKDYLNWIPEGTLLGTVSRFFKNLWSSKPPLMVTGIGGIGKSTLIAKFIVDHMDYHGRGPLPFVYLDFDKPGLSLSNNMALLAEALRQLKTQFPEKQEIYDDINQRIRQDYMAKENYAHRSRESDRERFFQEYTEKYGALIDIPVLVVFDSFEEIQCRASTTELKDFFTFVKQLNEFIPRLRCVFVGRSEVKFENQKFQKIGLTSFDMESAIGFLSGYGLKDKKAAEQIYEKFGGNPLTLVLAANIILREQKADKMLTSIDVGNIFWRIDEALIQEQLVKRNLDHIHNQQVSAIAIPGILVRLINPEIIERVMARACGLGSISSEESGIIFNELKKETFLIQEEGSSIYFRQDLRISLRDLIVKSDPDKARAIHTAAIDYYSEKNDAASRAEYIYHRLMRGDSTHEIEPFFDASLRPFLERSLVEFTDEARLNIAPLLNFHLETQTIEHASDDQWEQYMIKNIQEALFTGDENIMLAISKDLRKRKKRSMDILFSAYEAKLYVRLNDFKQARKIFTSLRHPSQRFSQNDDAAILYIGIRLFESKTHEYEHNFKQAFEMIQELMQSNYFKTSDPFGLSIEYSSVIADLLISYSRLQKRLLLHDTIIPMAFKTWEKSLTDPNMVPKTYQRHVIPATKGNNTSILGLEYLSRHFWSETDFVSGLKQLKASCKKNIDLEKLLYNNWKVSLKDVTEPGEQTIVFQDALMYIEQNIGRKEFDSLLPR